LSYSFNDNEQLAKKTDILRDIVGEIIFCPKCGTRNDFTSVSSTQTSFFCQRCSTKISDYWESFRKGKMQITGCELCSQQTFVTHKYCISCGEIKEKAAQARSEKIAEQVTTKKSRFSIFHLRIFFLVDVVIAIVASILIIVSSFSGYTGVDKIMLILGIITLCLSIVAFGYIIFLFKRSIRKVKI
jgi:predicted nucleic acid-binding Zn ribbon protein